METTIADIPSVLSSTYFYSVLTSVPSFICQVLLGRDC